MRLWPADYYITSMGQCPVREFLRKLPTRDAAKCVERIEWLEDYDPAEAPPTGYIHHVRGDIDELRRPWQGRQYRILFARVRGQRVVLLHGIHKKTNALDEADIRTAMARLGDCRSRGLC